MRTSPLPDVLGIDFGTSNSAVGVVADGKSQLLCVEGDHNTLPTSVFFDSEERTVLVGRAANRALIEHYEGRFMRALKSVLGTSLMHEQQYLLGKRVTFVDVVADFLRHLKQSAEEVRQQEFNYALSGRPVHFHSQSAQRDAQAEKDLTQCYEAAGFKGVSYMREPEAAALSSGGLRDGDVALIVDIGGGTSDFCLFTKKAEGIEVHATSGVRIGGTDFDKSLSVEFVMPSLGYGETVRREMGEGLLQAPNWIYQDLATWEKIPTLYREKPRALAKQLRKLAINERPFSRLWTVLEEELGHDLAFLIEAAKIQTNKNGRSNIDLNLLEQGLEVELLQIAMEACLQSHADQIKNCALETVSLAQLAPEKVDQVIFVGGSSLMKSVEGAIAPHFPDAKFQYSNAFTAIVDGLALATQKYG